MLIYCCFFSFLSIVLLSNSLFNENSNKSKSISSSDSDNSHPSNDLNDSSKDSFNPLRLKPYKKNFPKSLFKMISKENVSSEEFSHSFYHRILPGIFEWLLIIKKAFSKREYEFDQALHSLRPAIQVIKAKFPNLDPLSPFFLDNPKIDNEEISLLKVFILFDYSNDSLLKDYENDSKSLNSIVNQFYYSAIKDPDNYFISSSSISISDSDSMRLAKKKRINHNVNDHDHDRAMIVSSIIAPSYNHQGVANDISKIIGKYEHDRSLMEIYDRVMNRLHIPKIKRRNLDFHTETFADQLYQILSPQQIEIPMFDQFWYDLVRLLFKWKIYMRQENVNNMEIISTIPLNSNMKTIGISENVNDNHSENKNNCENEKFIMASYSIDQFVKIIGERNGYTSFPVSFSLESHHINNLSIFRGLMECEIMEHDQAVFIPFASIVNDFYGGGEREERDYCKELEVKYFNGNFDKNVVLKSIIILHDPKEMIKKKCFSYGGYPRFHPTIPPDQIDSVYLDNLRISGPKGIQIFEMEYLTSSIVEFYLKNKMRFRIHSPRDFSILLGVIRKRRDLMTKETIKNIFGFFEDHEYRNHDEFPKWNSKMFKKFLKRSILTNLISKREYNEYLNLMK